MRLTRYTDYCCRVLIYVALNGNRLSTTREISQCFAISNNHLMKVVYDLNLKGYIETIRGKNGGIRLGRAPEQISIGALIRDTEEEFRLVECDEKHDEAVCRIANACNLRRIVGEATEAFLAVLDSYTLADLLKPQHSLRHLLMLRIDPPGQGLSQQRAAD